MRFEHEFAIDAPEDEAWAALMDIERVAPCMPGAKVVEKRSDTSFAATIKVKLGPVTMNYAADLEVADRNDAEHTARMTVAAKETRGQGNAEAEVAMSVTGDGAGARARIVTELNLTGRAASMGQSLIADVSAMLVDRFATNLAKMLAGEQETDTPPGPAGAGTAAPPDPGSDSISPDEPGLEIGSILIASATRQARARTTEISLLALLIALIALMRSGR